jgi:protein-L-isoaspartate(D-aspartate) O-methyltransferase
MKIFASLLAITLLLSTLPAPETRQREREEMVRRQIEARGVSDPATLQAMRNVPRHLFLPPERSRQAYTDSPVPIGQGQTISQPYIVAYMTEIVRPDREHRVLEIGTGSGYQAAVLAEIVSEVYTIEIIPELAHSGEKVLGELAYQNVKVKAGDGYYGWEEYAPFDAIVVTAAAEHIPPPLIEQLKEGGRMIIPVGSPFMTQNLMLVEKQNGRITTTSLMPVRFVPFTRQKD